MGADVDRATVCFGNGAGDRMQTLRMVGTLPDCPRTDSGKGKPYYKADIPVHNHACSITELTAQRNFSD